MAYYRAKKPAEAEYVRFTNDLYQLTLERCMKLPQRWYDAILKPMIDTSRKARDYARKADSVYANLKTQSPEEFAKALNVRVQYLGKALDELKLFDMAIDDLMSYADLRVAETNRLRCVIQNIVNDIIKEDTRVEKEKKNELRRRVDERVKEYFDGKKSQSKPLPQERAEETDEAGEILLYKVRKNRKELDGEVLYHGPNLAGGTEDGACEVALYEVEKNGKRKLISAEPKAPEYDIRVRMSANDLDFTSVAGMARHSLRLNAKGFERWIAYRDNAGIKLKLRIDADKKLIRKARRGELGGGAQENAQSGAQASKALEDAQSGGSAPQNQEKPWTKRGEAKE